MKYHVADWNNVLQEVKEHVGSVDPMEADALVMFNDVRGSYKDLAETTKKFTPKPVYVMQHGRAASRDYDKPNSFPLLADKFLAWGQADFDRMKRLGYGDRTEIVGCPLLRKIQPRVEREEKNVIFIPVNSDHEEPENLLVYYELLKMKYGSAQSKLKVLQKPLGDKWSLKGKISIPFHYLTDVNVIAKLLPRHDKNLYHGDTFVSNPDDPRHMSFVFDLLANADCIVTLDESTTEVLAMAADVPVVCCDIYSFKTLGGAAYGDVERIRTDAATHCTLDNLQDAVREALNSPGKRRKERREVAAYELGTQLGDPVENVLKAIGAK